jgi:hypothetical protein
MVTRTRLCITLYVHYLSCSILQKVCDDYYTSKFLETEEEIGKEIT